MSCTIVYTNSLPYYFISLRLAIDSSFECIYKYFTNQALIFKNARANEINLANSSGVRVYEASWIWSRWGTVQIGPQKVRLYL